MGSAADEEQILAGLRAGDPQAFERLVRRDVGRLRAVARRLLQNDADADEVVQEAFLSAYRNLDGFRHEAGLSSWLHRITVNAALQRLRKCRTARNLGQLIDVDAHVPQFQLDGYPVHMHQPWVYDADELLAREQTREQVRKMIDRLPENYRTVLILRDIEELSTAESAALLELAPGTLKVRLHRARQALRNLLEREFELTGTA